MRNSRQSLRKTPVSAVLGLVVLIIAGCGSSTDSGRRGDVFGHVYEAESHEPLAGAILSCAGSSDTTSADGSYRLTDLPSGIHEVKCSHAGYYTQKETVQMSGGQQELDFVLIEVNPEAGLIPAAVGNTWIYEVVESSPDTTYLDTITIVSLEVIGRWQWWQASPANPLCWQGLDHYAIRGDSIFGIRRHSGLYYMTIEFIPPADTALVYSWNPVDEFHSERRVSRDGDLFVYEWCWECIDAYVRLTIDPGLGIVSGHLTSLAGAITWTMIEASIIPASPPQD